MSFGHVKGYAFFGTVFQQMRLGSLFAILSPFLLVRSKWYIIPLLIAAAVISVSGFALALLGCIAIYAFLTFPKYRLRGCIVLAVVTTLYVIHDWNESFRVSIIEGRLPIWLVIIKSWMLDTMNHPLGQPDIFGISQTGPFDLKRFLFGHGLDTFLPLFPLYKHDPNPFPQAHNSWLQLGWETGLIGLTLFTAYCISLLYRLYKRGLYLEFSSLWILGVNMFFHFPDRMTQTIWWMVAYLAYCEQRIRVFDRSNFYPDPYQRSTRFPNFSVLLKSNFRNWQTQRYSSQGVSNGK